MNDIRTTKSDTDVSESNSWIVLCECEEFVKLDNEKHGDCTTCAAETFPDIVIVENSELLEISSDTKNKDNEKTVDENQSLGENKMASENVCDERTKCKGQNKSKPKKKRRMKNQANDIGTLLIIGTVLAIAGASLLCLLTPSNPSAVSQLHATYSKSAIVKDVSVPLTSTVNKSGRKLNLLDKDGSLQTYLSNHGFTVNASNSLDVEKCFGPRTYQQFDQKIETFNKQYGNPSIRVNRPKDQTDTRKGVSVPVASHNTNAKFNDQKINPPQTIKNSSPPEPSIDQTQLQYKMIFNVLQDLALLRLTQIFANQLAKKIAKQKKKVVPKKKIVKKLEPLVKVKKQSSSSTALVLWDELPFNHEISSNRANMLKEEKLKKINSKLSLTEIANKTSRGRIIEKHKKRQLDYLEKLKLEHKDRMAYLKSIREHQQKSIQALIQERKEDLKKLNQYTEQQQQIMEGKTKLLRINDFYRKLASKSTSDISHQVINRVCAKTPSPSITTISRKTSSAKVVNKNLPRECLNTRGKYCEQLAKYWSKREEYFNERIKFMKEVSGSLREVMRLYTNADVRDSNNSKCAIRSIINKASLVFPDNSNLHSLKSEMQMFDSSSNLNVSGICDRKQSDFQLDRYCSLHNFPRNRQCPLLAAEHNMVKGDDKFRKKGNLIRRKNLAIFHCKTFPKTIQ